MRQTITRCRNRLTFGLWLTILGGGHWVESSACAQEPTPKAAVSPSPAVEERLRRLEEVNARLLERLDRDRDESAQRYRVLEERYRELQRRLGEPPATPALKADVPPETGEATARRSHLGRPGELGKALSVRELPLKARFADGFQLASEDEEFDLRFHVLNQTDAEVFAPNNRTFGKSGLYIPRVRLYLEGRLTKLWDYEVSLQRSLEGSWDLLDGNVNFHPSDAFQVKFGRQLVPYSYDWFDHLEQYFIAPERALFPLNFGLSRQAGLMGWGHAREGKLDWALGVFNGHLTGLADNNPNLEGVGYLNFRPFLGSEQFPALHHLNVGASGSIGEITRNDTPLPMRTSVQSSDNDEAAEDASAVFLAFNKGTVYQGARRFAAVHLAYYYHGLSFESEWNIGRFQMTRPGLGNKPEIPVGGFHTTLSYFLTGEQIERRTVVQPLRPFQPFHGEWGLGAFEPFIRYSQLNLGENLFTEGLAEGRLWSNDAGMIDLGMNWYPNRWVKFYLTWQHAMFGSPVLVNEAKNTFSRDMNLFWVRGQVYF
ncbi:OprO/OprP family phosphate-selective porin [Singulisphaera acidiphila]|uniref:Phosphate-selective porin n=1 Tax=Singulisphaera acidiphila (strain ATCC BAA-1392 / DSM 18658 / VKM B-2454 / MOB10) TaxID=886293 RepID=L0DIV8_SINAD|nr:porin [Singulisphaera acidiphila]AGA29319.1 phosphate-selective porin [Singulisphaera acidiphila DSM 18658]